MPRISEKEKRRRELWAVFLKKAHTKGARDPCTRRLLALHEGFVAQRYMEPRVHILKNNWADSVLPTYSDAKWRNIMRVDPPSFEFILRQIRDHPVFSNKSNRPQDPVDVQLKLALYRLAYDGSGVGFNNTAHHWGVSEGHISNCTKRVVFALFQLQNQFIQWPDTQDLRKESLENLRRAGFLGCVGKIDGTDIGLPFKPGQDFDGEQFWNRKKRYAIDLCGVCNSDRKFTYILTGYSSATHDSRVYRHTRMYKDPAACFGPGLYLLGDSAYPASRFLVLPYPMARQAVRLASWHPQTGTRLVLNME